MSHRADPHRERTGPKLAPPRAQPAAGEAQPGGEAGGCHDAELIRRVAEGQQDAFEELYDRYAGYVFNLCRRVVGDDTAAEEAVIDTFWECWNRPERYNPKRGTLLTYLLMLARCRAIDRRRGEMAAQRLARQAGAAGDSDHPSDMAGAGRDRDPADGDPMDEELHSAFNRLNPKCQEAVRLCLVQGLTASQAADLLDVPLGTIKSRIRKSIIQMREWLRT